MNLQDVLAALDGYDDHGGQPVEVPAPLLADARRLLLGLAIDFDEYADHGLDEQGVACPNGDLIYKREARDCTCGLKEARERWRT